MTHSRKKLGQWGESLAATHLEANGYTVVARNWRCARGEIDLIVRGGEVLIFVEVKTRRGRGMGSPEESVTPHKLKKLFQLAQTYLYENDLDDNTEWRIDLVAVELDPKGKLLRCEHIPNFAPNW